MKWKWKHGAWNLLSPKNLESRVATLCNDRKNPWICGYKGWVTVNISTRFSSLWNEKIWWYTSATYTTNQEMAVDFRISIKRRIIHHNKGYTISFSKTQFLNLNWQFFLFFCSYPVRKVNYICFDDFFLLNFIEEI